MALKETIKHLRELLHQITSDIQKSDNGNKAASQRVRTGTVKLEKVAKKYRKESIQNEKSIKGTRKPKKAASKKAAPKAKAHKATKAHAKAKTSHVKAKAKAKAHKAKPRALALKRRPTAKLPLGKKHALRSR